MAAGRLRKADPLQAADDFLDMLVSARYLTAVVLGQTERFPRPQAHVEHVVDLFLNFYGAGARAKKPTLRAASKGAKA